jgi:RHS repeat-associated protein
MTAKEVIASGERVEYEWDHRNRLVRIVSKDEFDAVTQVVEQTYDYQNRWVRSQIDADGDEDFDSERFFAYDGNQIVLEFAGDAASDLSHRYLWGPAVDQILADESVDSLTSAGDVLWPLTDHLNTTRDLAEYDSGTDTTTIASHRVFDSFGNLLSETNGSVTILFGFTARPFDVESGLQWNLNRWYVSTLGVWMSEDPIGLGPDSNPRRYVENQPTMLTDPSGLAPPGTQWWNNSGWDNWNPSAWAAAGGDAVSTFVSGIWYYDATVAPALQTHTLNRVANGTSCGQELASQRKLDAPSTAIVEGLAQGDIIFLSSGGSFVRPSVGSTPSPTLSSPVRSGYTRVYRAVGKDEYLDSVKTGQFRQGPNSLEGKWFADSIQGAQTHGEALFGKDGFRLIAADVPDNASSLFRQPNLDGRGPARYLHCDDLKSVTPRPMK